MEDGVRYTIADVLKWLNRDGQLGNLPPGMIDKNGEDVSHNASNALVWKSTDGSVPMRAGFLVGLDMCIKLLKTVVEEALDDDELRLKGYDLMFGYISALLCCATANFGDRSVDKATKHTAHNLTSMREELRAGMDEMKGAVPVPQKEDWE